MNLLSVISEIENTLSNVQFKHNLDIKFMGFNVQLVSNSSTINTLIKRHLYYNYCQTDPNQYKDWTVTLLENRDIYEKNKTLFQTSNSELEYGDPAFTFQANYKTIVPQKTRSIIIINNNNNHVYIIGYDLRGLFIDSYKTIRRIFTNLMVNNRMFCLHASGVEKQNQGLLFAGQKGSGKTTAILHLISRYPSLGYINNDKIWIEAKESYMAIGSWPTVMPIGIDSILSVPGMPEKISPDLHLDAGGISLLLQDLELIQEDWETKKGKVRLCPAEIKYLFNVELKPEATLSTIVFPSMSHEGNDINIRKLDHIESRNLLKENIMLDFSNHKDWLSEHPAPQVQTRQVDLFIDEVLNKAEVWKISSSTSNFRNAVFAFADMLWK